MAELREIFVHVAYGRGSVLLWRRCDTLCTSGFADDVMISYPGANGPESSLTLCFEEVDYNIDYNIAWSSS